MSVIIKRTRKSSQSYGRGRDQAYQPAFYDIIKDGKTVGHIMARSVVYMETPTWQVLEIIDGVAREVRTFYRDKPFTKAKEWALEHFVKPLPLTGDIWNRMTPIQRENLGLKAKLDAQTRGERWDGLWPAEKRALIREYKKERGATDSFANKRIGRRTPRITPKTPRLRR